MCSTTNPLDALWHVHHFMPWENTPTIEVADKTKHKPTACGYLRVPTVVDQNRHGYTMIECFYTPTLADTIILPDPTGHQHGGVAYSRMSRFNSFGIMANTSGGTKKCWKDSYYIVLLTQGCSNQ